MEDIRDVTIGFEKEIEPLSFKSFSEYMRLFRTVYIAAGHEFGDLNIDNEYFLKHQEDFINDFFKRINRNPDLIQGIEDRYNEIDLGDKEIIIKYINYESPLIIMIAGVFIILTLAIVISGGELEMENKLIGKIKFKVPPLHTGINGLLNIKKNGDRLGYA